MQSKEEIEKKRNEYKNNWRRNKNLSLGKIPRAKNPTEKFFRKVKKTDSCWIWTGEHTKFGHGRFQPGGRGSKRHQAHRWIFEQTIGCEIPKEMYCCHKCETRNCVNPEHIYLGTQKQNVADAIAAKKHSSVRNSEKKFCPSGHEYTPENTKHMKHKRGRQCVQCSRVWANERYHRLKQR